ncbi:hypothetical protein RJ640_029509 [Escallonia rubra]|uniref:Uncharacterized protein n=1 Tax=Escallonia rubra TaxID=112253 RepID=A0AA88UR58_9ASTE|nr:hypothetical protein RJ640_029509 [Escallonia rubra]
MVSSISLAYLALLATAILFNTLPVSASLGQKTTYLAHLNSKLTARYVSNAMHNDVKYRCSETGYRIPLKCIDVEAGSKESNNGKKQNDRSTLENSYDKEKVDVMLRDAEEVATISRRNLLDDSSMSKDASEAYITYRSCIAAVNEEKLSVLGFEFL